MVEEVLERVELLISVQGGRKISRENLEFMFDKYELSEEEREQVLATCKEKRIAIYNETGPEDAAKKVSKEEPEAEKEEKPKKGFFARLFGR